MAWFVQLPRMKALGILVTLALFQSQKSLVAEFRNSEWLWDCCSRNSQEWADFHTY